MYPHAVDFKKLEYGPGTISDGGVFFVGFWVEGLSYSNFLGFTVLGSFEWVWGWHKAGSERIPVRLTWLFPYIEGSFLRCYRMGPYMAASINVGSV